MRYKWPCYNGPRCNCGEGFMVWKTVHVPRDQVRVRNSRSPFDVIKIATSFITTYTYFISVPIIPDFLVELEVEAENVLLDDYLFNVTGGNWSNFHLFSNATIPPIHNHTWRSGFGFPVVPQERLFSDVNSRVGWLFASKAIVQLCANGFIGSATNRYFIVIVVPIAQIIVFNLISAIWKYVLSEVLFKRILYATKISLSTINTIINVICINK